MIKINLLPQDMVGAAQRSAGGGAGAGTALVALVILVLLAANVGLGGYVVVTRNTAQARVAEAEDKLEGLQTQLETTELEYNETRQNLEYMEKLISVANTLAPEDQVLWSRKLNQLPLLVPQNVYLTEIAVTQKIDEKPTPESLKAQNDHIRQKKEGRPPALEMIPVYTQTLTMRGVAYVPDGSDTERLQQIITFYQNLQNQNVTLPYQNQEASFLNGMRANIGLSPVTGRNVEGREVSEFFFTLQTQPLEVR